MWNVLQIIKSLTLIDNKPFQMTASIILLSFLLVLLEDKLHSGYFSGKFYTYELFVVRDLG